MINHRDFHLSDWVAQNNPGWRVRWGPQTEFMTLIVDLASPREDSRWRLFWCDEDPHIVLNRDGKFVPREGVKIHQAEITLSAEAFPNLPLILGMCYDDHYRGTPAPRRKHATPYITKEEATELEQHFFDMFIAPYQCSHTIYAVHKSGTLLLERLGVTPFSNIFVNHYASNTFQDDDKVEVDTLDVEDSDKPVMVVLVVDDMVSSGHTAAAIIKAFNDIGITRVRYVTLLDIVASREDHSVDATVESLKSVSNHYWMFGRGMDLVNESSRSTQHIYGADKSFDTELPTDIAELKQLFAENEV